jgi:hypothetical protein
MKIEKKIPILNYEYSVIFLSGDSIYLKNQCSAWGYPEFDSDRLINTRGLTIHKPGHHPIIMMPRLPNDPDSFATLAHEACHAVDRVFWAIGDSNRDELFAHCVAAIVRGVLKIKKRK